MFDRADVRDIVTIAKEAGSAIMYVYKEVILVGSSLKICLVAEGVADIYPRLGPTMEWDTEAAHAVINESKKSFKAYANNKYLECRYNKENLLNAWFVVI